MSKIRVFVRSTLVTVDKYEVDIPVPQGNVWQMPTYDRKTLFRQERVFDEKSKRAISEARKLAAQTNSDVEVIDVSLRNILERVMMRPFLHPRELPAVVFTGDHASMRLQSAQTPAVDPLV